MPDDAVIMSWDVGVGDAIVKFWRWNGEKLIPVDRCSVCGDLGHSVCMGDTDGVSLRDAGRPTDLPAIQSTGLHESGEPMTQLLAALVVLASIHTRADKEIGFYVPAQPHPSDIVDLPAYVNAWQVVHEYVTGGAR